MNPIAQVVYMSLTVLIHYQILTLCLMGVVAFHGFKSDSKKLIRKVIAFSISIAILVGIPMGIVEGIYPEETKGDVESVIIKEVTEWDQ